MRSVFSWALLWFQVLIISKAEFNSLHDDPDYQASLYNKEFQICDQTKVPKKRIVCYYRVDESFRPFNIDPCLCTHIIYSYVVIKENFAFVAGKKGDLKFLENLKTKNRNLKTLVSVRPSGKDFSVDVSKNDASSLIPWPSVSNQTVISKLARKVKEFVIRHNLDGIDLDWEYFRGSDHKVQKENLVSVVRIFKALLRQSNEANYSLTITTSKYSQDLTNNYDFVNLNRYLDFVNVPAFHFDTEGKTVQHPARLHGTSDMENMDSLIDLVLALGLPSNKLTIGVPSHGIFYKLQNMSLTTPGSPSIPWEQNEAFISLSKICAIRDNTNWTLVRERDSTAPYIYYKDKWIGFDDEISIKLKAKYALLRQIGGVALWSINDDDPMGKCGYGPFPLIQIVRLIFNNPVDDINVFKSNTTSNNFGVITSFVDVIEKYGNVERIIEKEGQADEFPCKTSGYMRHPKECSKFYRCVKTNENSNSLIKFQYSCAQGLLFDDTYSICNWPSWTPPCGGSEEIQPVTKKSFTCPSYGYFQDQDDCEYFYYCSDFGKDYFQGYEFKCPFSLGFDEEKLLCNWKWLVKGCKVTGQEKHDTRSIDALFEHLPQNFFNNGETHLSDNFPEGENIDQLLSRSDDFDEVKYVDTSNLPAEHRKNDHLKSRRGFARALKEQVNDFVESVGSKVKILFGSKDESLKRKDRSGSLADWLHNHNPFAAPSHIVPIKMEPSLILKPKRPTKEQIITIPVIEISHQAPLLLNEMLLQEPRPIRVNRPSLHFLKPLSENQHRLPSLNSVLRKKNYNRDVIAIPVITINKDQNKRGKGKWLQIQRRPDNGLAFGTNYYKNRQNYAGQGSNQHQPSHQIVIPLSSQEEIMIPANFSTPIPIPIPKHTVKLNIETTQSPPIRHQQQPQHYQTSESIRSTANNQKLQNPPIVETLSAFPFNIPSLNNLDISSMELNEFAFGPELGPTSSIHQEHNQHNRNILRVRVPALLEQVRKQAEYHNTRHHLQNPETSSSVYFPHITSNQVNHRTTGNQQSPQPTQQPQYRLQHHPQHQFQHSSQRPFQYQQKSGIYNYGQNLQTDKWQHSSPLNGLDIQASMATSQRPSVSHSFKGNNGFVPIKSDSMHIATGHSSRSKPLNGQQKKDTSSLKVSETSNQYQYQPERPVTVLPILATTSDPISSTKKAKLLIIPVPDDHPQAQTLKDIERLAQEYPDLFPEKLNLKKLSELGKEKLGSTDKEDYIYVVIDHEKIKNLTKFSEDDNKIKPLGAIALNRLFQNPQLLASILKDEWTDYAESEEVTTTVASKPKPSIHHQQPSVLRQTPTSRYQTSSTTSRYQPSTPRYVTSTTSAPRYQPSTPRYVTTTTKAPRYQPSTSRHVTTPTNVPRYQPPTSRYVTTTTTASRYQSTYSSSLSRSSPFTAPPSRPVLQTGLRRSPLRVSSTTQPPTTVSDIPTEYFGENSNQEATTYVPEFASAYHNSHIINGHQKISHALYESIQNAINHQYSAKDPISIDKASYSRTSSSHPSSASDFSTSTPDVTASYDREENGTLNYVEGHQDYHYQPEEFNETGSYAQSWPTYPQSWYQYTYHPQPIYAQSNHNLSSLEYQYYPIIEGYQEYNNHYEPQHLNSSFRNTFFENSYKTWSSSTSEGLFTEPPESFLTSEYISDSQNLKNHKLSNQADDSTITDYSHGRRMPSTEASVDAPVDSISYHAFDSRRIKDKPIQIYRIQGANKKQVKTQPTNNEKELKASANVASENDNYGENSNPHYLDRYHYTYGTANKPSSSNYLLSYTSTENTAEYHKNDYIDDPAIYNHDYSTENDYLPTAKVQSLQSLYNTNLYNGLRNFSDGSVPEAACTRAGLFQHPNDCNKFYECYWDKYINKFTLHLFECPVKLAFDSRIIGCSAPSDPTVCVQY